MPLATSTPKPTDAALAPEAELTPRAYDDDEAEAAAEARRHPGKVLVASRSKGLLITGGLMLGIGYVFTAGVGALGSPIALAIGARPGGLDMICWDHARWGLVPVVGPWIAVGVAGPAGCLGTSLGPATIAFAVVTGIIQDTGLALLVVGLVKKSERWVPRELTEEEVSLLPAGPNGTPGATLSLRF